MKIGDAALTIGVDVHVLRHWEDVGVVVPERTSTGHRDYSDEHVHRLRIVRACQRVGLSLDEIRQVLSHDASGRAEVIADRLERIRRQRAELAHAEVFLTHVIECRHDFVTQCPHCSTYPAEGQPGVLASTLRTKSRRSPASTTDTAGESTR